MWISVNNHKGDKYRYKIFLAFDFLTEYKPWVIKIGLFITRRNRQQNKAG